MVEIMILRDPWLHLRFEGYCWVLPLADLGLSLYSGDAEVRGALMFFLGVPLDVLAPYVIERHLNGNLSVFPETVSE